MTYQINAHGFTFTVEPDGFTRHEADRDAAIDAVETALRNLPKEDVARLHAGSMADADGEIVDDELFWCTQTIASSAKNTALADWIKPEEASLTVYGVA